MCDQKYEYNEKLAQLMQSSNLISLPFLHSLLFFKVNVYD